MYYVPTQGSFIMKKGKNKIIPIRLTCIYEAGEIAFALNGVEHFFLSVDGDLGLSRVKRRDRIPGIQYEGCEMKVWR